ncbi:helix-turn-helix domain-containing protein [Clostridium perfringens]|uniref:helix-turn-helix domain-containing protein n=1 Tax=Clostridium perfringens TaxID=1502 RepID=UPI002ED01A65|nr:helix-turn-helix domain-containing protein [Clostridium perfringens]
MADKEVLSEGFTQIPNKLIKYKDLDCIEKMILINFMSYGENIYPSISRICEELNISRPTCVKKIKALKDNGYLKVTKNKSLNGDYDNNSYEVVKNINHLVKEFNYGSKNILPQVVKEINSNNTNKTILNNNIYSSLENELDTKEIEKDLINKINSKYSKELIKEELEKLKDKDISKLDLLKELDKNLKSKSKDNSNQDIEEIWSLYPLKKGKASAIKKIPKLLKEYGKEQIVRCIERYIEEIKKDNKSKEFILHGSTFFNGRYIDYLDCNYQEDIINKPKEEPKLKNNISNFDY